MTYREKPFKVGFAIFKANSTKIHTALYTAGSIVLKTGKLQFINEQCEKHFIENISLDNEAIFHLTELPAYHRDPFDRMLICQAIEHDLTLLTSDELITQYPVKTAW